MVIRPQSILQLTVTGFLVVTVILIIALIATAQQMGGLSERSQRTVRQTTVAMGASRTLVEQSGAMERNARQYSILRDPEILAVYIERQETFLEAAKQLRELNLNNTLAGQVNAIEEQEEQAYLVLGASAAADIESRYQSLLLLAYQIANSVNEWANLQTAEIDEEAIRTQYLLTVQAFFLVGIAILLAGLFTALITRPLVQVEKVISELGRGEYDNAISIKGPTDLVNLGRQLEWLRDRFVMLEQQRSQFLRHVSHELKTPLAAIQESSNLLAEGVVGELSTDQRELIRIQGKSLQRLQTLIDGLLRHHSDSFSVLNTLPTRLRLDSLIREVIADNELNLKPACLKVKTRLDKITVESNYEQLRVVIDNLLSNAIRFSPVNGVILLALIADGSEAVIKIKDQGPGIPEAEYSKIFDAFYQGDQPTRGSYQGSGLGLAISQEYVAANGGSIAVAPTLLGACFVVRIPLARVLEVNNEKKTSHSHSE